MTSSSFKLIYSIISIIINLQEHLAELIEDASDDEQLTNDKNANKLNGSEEKQLSPSCKNVAEVEKQSSPICNGTVEEEANPSLKPTNKESLNDFTTKKVTAPTATVQTVQKPSKPKTPASKKSPKQTTSKKTPEPSIALQPLRKSIRRNDDAFTDEDARVPSKVRVLSTRNTNKKDLQKNQSQVSVCANYFHNSANQF